MGNINQPIKRYLFNVVSPKDWGHYTNAAGVDNIILKKHGITIPKGTGVTVVKQSDYMPGRQKAMFLEKNKYPVVPGEPYTFGYTFEKVMQKPGQNNDQYFPVQKYYFGKVNGARALSGGVVNDLDVLEIEDQIIALAKAESEAQPNECFVNLRRSYVISDVVNSQASGFTVTLEDGTTVVFATAATFTAGQIAIQFNALATVNTKLVAFRNTANECVITSIDPFYKFYIGTETGDATIEHRHVYAENKEVGYKVTAIFDPREATCVGAYVVVLDDTNGSTAGNTATSAYVNKTLVAVTGHGTYANLVANFNTALNASAVYATAAITNLIYVYAPATIKQFTIKLPDANVLIRAKDSSPEGAFPSLTSDDVFAKFVGRGSKGALANRSYTTNQPIEGGIYRKYILTVSSDNESLTQSAGGRLKVDHVFEFYVLKSEALATRLYNAGSKFVMADAPASPNISLAAMIAL